MGKYNNRGITLIELVVVVAIIVLFAIISVPFSLDLFEAYQLNYNTNKLVAIFLNAKQVAHDSKEVVVINLNQSGIDDKLNRFFNPAASVTLSTSNNAPQTLYMNPNGYLQISATNSMPMKEFDIRLCHEQGDASTSRTIIIRTYLMASDGVVKNNCDFF